MFASYLKQNTFSLTNFFSQYNIVNLVKQNLPIFVGFIKKHSEIAKQLIYYATRLSSLELDEINNKKYLLSIFSICCKATQILCNDQQIISNLYFRQNVEQCYQQNFENQFIQHSTKQKSIISYSGNNILQYLLEFVYKVQSIDGNNNCYERIINLIINHKGIYLMQYLQNNVKYVDSWIQNMDKNCHMNMLLKLINFDCKNKDRFEQLKNNIKIKMEFFILQNLQNQDICDTICILFENIFLNRVFQNKIMKNPVITNIRFATQLYNKLSDPKIQIDNLKNICRLIILILKSIKNQIIQDYIVSQTQSIKINFNFVEMLDRLKTEEFMNLNNYIKNLYFQFLIQIYDVLKHQKQVPGYSNIINTLLAYLNINTNGILKSSIVFLLQKIIRSSDYQFLNNLQLQGQLKFHQYFPNLSQQQLTKSNFNLNCCLAFESSLVIQVQKKLPNFFKNVSHSTGIELSIIQKRYCYILGGLAPPKKCMNPYQDENANQNYQNNCNVEQLFKNPHNPYKYANVCNFPEINFEKDEENNNQFYDFTFYQMNNKSQLIQLMEQNFESSFKDYYYDDYNQLICKQNSQTIVYNINKHTSQISEFFEQK